MLLSAEVALTVAVLPLRRTRISQTFSAPESTSVSLASGPGAGTLSVWPASSVYPSSAATGASLRASMSR